MQLAPTLRHVPFPVIGEFRHVIKAVNEACLYHKLATKPKLCFIGTTKMHGSNASVVLQRGGKVYAQSRDHLLTEELRLHGFYDFVEATRCRLLNKHLQLRPARHLLLVPRKKQVNLQLILKAMSS